MTTTTPFSHVRSFFRTQLNSIRFKEWKDAFNVDNIPETILQNSYHIETVRGARRNPYNAMDQEFEQDVTLRVFKKGFRNPSDAVDDCLSALDQITGLVLDTAVRVNCNIKNIYLNNFEIRPLADTNDNAAVLEVTFSCLIIIYI